MDDGCLLISIIEMLVKSIIFYSLKSLGKNVNKKNVGVTSSKANSVIVH